MLSVIKQKLVELCSNQMKLVQKSLQNVLSLKNWMNMDDTLIESNMGSLRI